MQDPHQSPSDLKQALSVLREAQERSRKGDGCRQWVQCLGKGNTSSKQLAGASISLFLPCPSSSLCIPCSPLSMFSWGSSCIFVPSHQITVVVFDSFDLCPPLQNCPLKFLLCSFSFPFTASVEVWSSNGVTDNKNHLQGYISSVVKLDKAPSCLCGL